jgi:hypothetical protein
MTKLHELTGQIIQKELRKVYDKKSPYQGNTHYKCQVLIENRKKEESLFVYPNLVSSEIFQIVKQSQYIDKRYLLFCEKKTKGWVLHRWEELQNKLEIHER